MQSSRCTTEPMEKKTPFLQEVGWCYREKDDVEQLVTILQSNLLKRHIYRFLKTRDFSKRED